MDDDALKSRFSALIRKKYPPQTGHARKERVVRLLPEEERELWECAVEINRRDAIRIQRQYPPKQLTLFFEVTA